MSEKLRLRTKPFPHQRKATARAVKQGSHAFFFDPRCGKTKAALDTIAVQRFRGRVQRVVIIAPIIAESVWRREIRTHYSGDYKYLSVFGHRSKGKGRGGNFVSFFFVNVDKLSSRERQGKGGKWRHTYADIIERWNPDLIVIDESHRLKRAGGVGATTAWHMVRRLRNARSDGRPWVYLLTGTPNPKGYIDLFAQFRILDESIFGTAKSTFEENYCIYGVGKRRYTILQYRNKAGILRKVKRHATVVSSAEAGLAGEYVPNVIRLELPKKARDIYEELVEEALVELDDGTVLDAANAGVLRQRLLQITGGYTTDGKEIHVAKLDGATDFLSDLCEQGQSVVVGTRFRPEVRALTDRCSRLGYRTYAIHGKVEPSDREAYVAAFQERARREPCALVFQTEAGSLSIELAEAAEVLFYSLPDRWDSFWQFIQRLGGPNQKHWPVRWTALTITGTVDIRVLAALRNKRDMHKEMMNSPADFLHGL